MPRAKGRRGQNLFCSIDDLTNEASVEQFFVNRLLTYLGYTDSQIAPKQSLSAHRISLGRKRVNFKPDYALKIRSKVRWICDAKAATEALDPWVGQCASYCLELNRQEPTNPTAYFMLTNGVTTEVYPWDSDQPILTLAFADFVAGSAKLDELTTLLGPQAFSKAPPAKQAPTFALRRLSISDLNSDFAWAHRYIYKKENLSYGAAFMEFVKIIFLKLLSDRAVHESVNAVVDPDGTVTVPIDEVRFSKHWIEQRETDHPNPLDALQFQHLLQGFETQIQQGLKKRIFQTSERLDLSSESIKALAERLEGADLFSIDADLNGRLFETFLNATLRGKALGQYFTPRSVVKLATQMGQLEATPKHVDTVLDACCGTGGFLIESLADMWGTIDSNESLSSAEREKLKLQVATQSIYGVDIARDPALARIARINMYLHGDGGSRVYQLDALDKSVRDHTNDTPELVNEKHEFKRLLDAHPDGFADVVLTNPPFAKEYTRKQGSESELLDEYELAFDHSGATRRPISTVRSSIMFLERYHDLLRPGGRMVTVIDDGILGSESYGDVRAWLREKFLVRAVVSLPGDAFQRSQARVKTSLVVLEKRTGADQIQPAVFMYYCTSVGVDDSPRQRILPADYTNREQANVEIKRVGQLYRDFQAGKASARPFIVPADAITERMDVKACLPKASRRVDDWQAAGHKVVSLGDLIEPIYRRGAESLRPDGVIDTQVEAGEVQHLRVRYDGFAEPGELIVASDSNYRLLYRVQSGDLVFSHINAIHGAIAVVTDETDGMVVTNEYTVARPKIAMDPRVVWAMVRSPEARADLLLLSTGIGRTRIDWPQASLLQLPMPTEAVQARIADRIKRSEEAERSAKELRQAAEEDVLSSLDLDSGDARSIIAAFKPPR